MQSLKIFISYSSQDHDLQQELLKQLKVFRINKPHLEIWDDGELKPGEKWDAVIKDKLHLAHIVLMLISANFFVSEYIWNIEVHSTLEREQQGQVSAIPIILKPCEWETTPIAQFQVLPKKGKPVTSFADKDAAFYEIVSGIKPVIKQWEQKLGF